MSKTFVFGDIHGRLRSLYALLGRAGILDENGERVERIAFTTNDHFEEYQVISIGDLANVVLEDVEGDKECLRALHEGVIDRALIGNHEAGLIFPTIQFGGFHRDPEVASVYNHLEREGKLAMSLLIGDTLLTHAGVHEYFGFASAQEAHDAITDVYTHWTELQHATDERFVFHNGLVEIPKYMLFDAVTSRRGGSAPMGSIVWADWQEPKNNNFSQIFGHTPTTTGPILTKWMGSGVYHLNIDCGVKANGNPSGVWLDEDGRIMSFVKAVMDDD